MSMCVAGRRHGWTRHFPWLGLFLTRVVTRLFEPTIQRTPIDAEDARSVRLVAADCVEHLTDVPPLHLVERDQLARRFGGDHDLARLVLLDLRREVVDRDLVEPA